jgi:carbon-monoxide dehydrogenase small subunit
MKHNIAVIINGEKYRLDVSSERTLLQMLREDIGLTGAKHGCESGECGACTVLLNGEAVYSCLVLAVEVDGARVDTVEGLAPGASVHPLQKAFLDHNGMQCGFCTSGMLMSARALLLRTSRPNEEEIREALVGNLCRCTGYVDVIKSVQVASRARR